MFFYNCSVFIYSTVAGHKCENLVVIVIAKGKQEAKLSLG